MRFSFHPITEAEARAVCGWRYPPPYAVYNASISSVPSLLDPANHYHAAVDEQGELVGFACFGPDARVPGELDQEDADDGVLDVGLGLRPDLTGRGLGPAFVEAILAHGRATFAPRGFRLAVLTFNRRAIAVYERAGFLTARIIRGPSPDGPREYLVMRKT
jgi:[ribosomal protein S18]-alanine N-acetyltransferase